MTVPPLYRMVVLLLAGVRDCDADPCDHPRKKSCGVPSSPPAGFNLRGNGWFSMSPMENKSHPAGDDRPSAHPPHGRNNISIECCSYYCLADPQCKGFHVYNPCTWTGGHSNCYIAYTDHFLPHNAADPSPAFLRMLPSPPPPPAGWQQRCVAPLQPPPPAPPDQKCLGGHTLKLDAEQSIESWLPQRSAHHDLVVRSMAFLDEVGTDPKNGLPVYFTHGQLPVRNYPHNPASLFTQWVDVALRLYAYSGNISWVEKAEAMLAYSLVNGTTPNSSEWAWPGVPYASSDAGDTLYRGSVQGNSTGKGDGVGVIEVDKIGGVALGWLALWKHHGSGAIRREFLEAALHCARVLSRHIKRGNRTASPWPFRVYARNDANRGGGELYTAHVVWNIQLLDAVLAIPGALSHTDAVAVRSARSLAWEWMVEFPVSNNNWCGYCEDLTTAGLTWAADGKCDYDSITYGMTSRHLMGVTAAGGVVIPSGGAGTGTPVRWQTGVPKMLRWVEGALIFWSKPGSGSPPVQYGAKCVSEQRADPNRMSCHTSRYASVQAQYAELLRNSALNASAVADAVRDANRSWAWSSYCLDDVGNVHVTPGQGETDTWFTVTIDTVLNTMIFMAAMPELGTPADETHIVHSTTVLRNVYYGNGSSALLVSYEPSDSSSVQKLRVQASALVSGVAVSLDGVQIERVRSVQAEQAFSKAQWSLYEETGVLEIAGVPSGRRVNLVRARVKIDDDDMAAVTENLPQRTHTLRLGFILQNRSLVMHHVSSCNQCGKSPQGKPGSWCNDPNCTAFRFDAAHLSGPDVAAIGCAALGANPRTFCLGGGGAIYAATAGPVPCPGGPCPPAPPAPRPPPPPPPRKLAFHLAATRGANDVNAIFGYKGVAHMFHQGGGGWLHYVSDDFTSWSELPTIIPPGGWDGSLTLLRQPNGSVAPLILYDCTSIKGCKPAGDDDNDDESGGGAGGSGNSIVGMGDPPIVGVARPVDPSDPNLTSWVKDARNPIYIAGSPSTYSGPSNIWRRQDGKYDFVMILGHTTGLFQSSDPTMHNWTLVNPKFFPKRGGGGGQFFPLPAPGGGPSGFTHMLQADFESDGTEFMAVGTYDEATESITNVPDIPLALDHSGNFRFVELGYRDDGTTMLNSGWITGCCTSITRQIGWDPELETLLSMPVPEVESLRGVVLGTVTSPTPLTPGVPKVLAPSNATISDVDFYISIPADAIAITVDICGAGVGHGAASVTRNDGAMSLVALVLSVGKVEASGRRAVTLGGSVPSIVTRPRPPQFELKKGESGFAFRALVDTELVEMFIAGGRLMTSAPGAALSPAAPVTVTANRSGAAIVNGTVWRMRTVFA
jgi:hypothetical protein